MVTSRGRDCRSCPGSREVGRPPRGFRQLRQAIDETGRNRGRARGPPQPNGNGRPPTSTLSYTKRILQRHQPTNKQSGTARVALDALQPPQEHTATGPRGRARRGRGASRAGVVSSLIRFRPDLRLRSLLFFSERISHHIAHMDISPHHRGAWLPHPIIRSSQLRSLTDELRTQKDASALPPAL